MSAPLDSMVIAALRAMVREEVQEALRQHQEAALRPEGYITTAEAARRAGVKQSTIQAWIGDGRLPASKPEKCRGFRIRPADLEQLLDGRKGQEPLRLEDHRAAAAARLAASLKPGRGAP